MVVSTPLGLLGASLHAGVAAVQLFLLLLAFKTAQRDVWLACLAAIAALAFVAWVTAVRRRRAMAGTPTSRIASAAQGYVELQGRGMPLDVNPLRSPVSGATCLWYSYQVEEKNSEDKWEMLEQAKSDTSFVLDDGSGRCLVDPEGAEILTRHCRRWNDGSRRYVEWTLLQQDRIYVLGNFLTRHPDHGLDAGADVRDQLAEWKRDQAGLLRRFDLNHDGQLDEREWALARRLAQRGVEKKQRELRQQPELHLVQDAPSRLFLISNHDPDQLARRFLWVAGVQLLVFIGALGFLGAWWRQGPGL
jgi:hypothetical protein